VTEPVGTPSYTELVTAVRREGETLLTAASQGLDAWVPTCEEWNVEALVEHVAGVYNNVLNLVSQRITTPSWDEVPLPDGAPMDVLRELLDDLVVALSDAEADTPVWNWAKGSDDVAAFWARRMAHESSVHRFDAQRAHGIAQPIDAELAADGVDELLDVIGPRVYKRDSLSGPNGTWSIQLSAEGMERLAVASSPQARARGTSSALLLAAYGRIPWSSQDVEGDESLLQAWSDCMNF